MWHVVYMTKDSNERLVCSGASLETLTQVLAGLEKEWKTVISISFARN